MLPLKGVGQVQGEEATSNFKESLRLDSEWLAKHELIDYSLLVGVHDRERFRESNGSEARERGQGAHVPTTEQQLQQLAVGFWWRGPKRPPRGE